MHKAVPQVPQVSSVDVEKKFGRSTVVLLQGNQEMGLLNVQSDTALKTVV